MRDTATLASEFREHLHLHLLPFWCGPALDHEQGGWMGWLSNDLKPDRAQPKGLIVNARILWTFSAAHLTHPEPLYRQMADRAFGYFMEHFWDARHGGAYWRLNDRGRVIDDVKKTYGQAFCIYALAEYHRAFGSGDALKHAIELFELLEGRPRDAEFGGWFEVCDTSWERVIAAPLSEKDQNEKKSMNTHLHVLEAYANLYRVWKDQRVAQRLRELLGFFAERILDSRTFHLHHFFDERWAVRSNTYTFGHDIEAAWLLCEAAEVLQDHDLVRRACTSALRIAEVVLREGIQPDGSLCYEGQGGRVIDFGRECWPQAEAVIGFLNAWQISGEDKYLQAAMRGWDYIQTHLVDRQHGEWFWRITPEGTVDPTLPKVSEWKGPYHASRMCLEAVRRLESPHGPSGGI